MAESNLIIDNLGVCPICLSPHPPMTRCNVDLIIKVVKMLKNERREFIAERSKHLNKIGELQNTLKEVVNEMERLYTIEKEFMDLKNENKPT